MKTENLTAYEMVKEENLTDIRFQRNISSPQKNRSEGSPD